MSEQDNVNFTHHYQTIYLKESNVNDFSKCETKRKLMTLTHATSLKL